jgi:hypothetical protein
MTTRCGGQITSGFRSDRTGATGIEKAIAHDMREPSCVLFSMDERQAPACDTTSAVRRTIIDLRARKFPDTYHFNAATPVDI